jgi:hypothetical protein
VIFKGAPVSVGQLRRSIENHQTTNNAHSAQGEHLMNIKLAEALLRRKELTGKVTILAQIKQSNVFELKTTRKQVHEGIDDIVAQVPKLTASQVTAEFDWHARQLRLIDAAIQQTNWTTEVEIDPSVMSDYKQPE